MRINSLVMKMNIQVEAVAHFSDPNLEPLLISQCLLVRAFQHVMA